MKKILLLISFFTFVNCAIANGTLNPIDAKEAECISKTSSTTVMLQCTKDAQNLWSKDVEIYYNKLLKALPKDKLSLLKTSQKSWLLYQENEFKLTSQMLDSKDGTMYRNTVAGWQREIVKKRAQELKIYYDILTY